MRILDTLTLEEKKVLTKFSYKKGEIIFIEGDFCNAVGIVNKGKIEIKTTSFSGEEILYNSIKQYQMFGNNLIFSDNPFYKGDVYAEEDSEIYFIFKKELLLILKNNPSFLINFLNEQSNFAKELNSRIKLLSFNLAEDRILFFLKENNGKCVYKSISALSLLLNLKRETVSRTISKLIKKGLITKDKNTIFLK